VPAGNHLIDSINIFTPIDWQIEAGDSYPVGNVVGQVSGKADKGCNRSVDALLADVGHPQQREHARWNVFAAGIEGHLTAAHPPAGRR
jgi:hypothetical protein